MVDSDLFQKGLKKRKQVLGEKYVDANLAGRSAIMATTKMSRPIFNRLCRAF